MNKNLVVVILLVTNIITGVLFFTEKNEANKLRTLVEEQEKKVQASMMEAVKQKDLAFRNEQLALENERRAVEASRIAEEERKKCAERKR